jgi:hypothetical protein
MTTYISPQPKLQFLDNNGAPLSGGKVYTYAAGTTTPLTTYTDYTGSTANSNPVILDSRGECSIWLGTSSYKFKLTTSTDVEVWTVDNISVLTSSANITFVESGTGAVTQTVQSKLRSGYVYPEDFGAVGNGSTNDTTALQNAINTGRDVYLAAGKTYLHTVALSVTTSNQWFGGPGILKTSGAINSVSVGGSSVGVKLSLNFNSPGQSSGYAIYISNADRVTIERAYLYDAFGALYVEQANTVQVEWMWGIIRGPGIKWFGNAAKRSDILSINFCVLDPGLDYYGFEWDGNCHSLNVKYMGLVCGTGAFVYRESAWCSKSGTQLRKGHRGIGPIQTFSPDFKTNTGGNGPDWSFRTHRAFWVHHRPYFGDAGWHSVRNHRGLAGCPGLLDGHGRNGSKLAGHKLRPDHGISEFGHLGRGPGL